MALQRSRAARAVAAVLLVVAFAPADASPDSARSRGLLRTHSRVAVLDFEHESRASYGNGTGVAKVASPKDSTESWDVSVEVVFAMLYVALIGSVPVLLSWIDHEGGMGLVAIGEIVALVVWLVGGLILFTNVILFSSYHWDGARCLSIVETVYLLSQIITTVGYGDITPAYARGQVVIGFYVLVSLLVIANVVKEVSRIVVRQVHRHVLGTVEAVKDAADGDTDEDDDDDDEPELTPNSTSEQDDDGGTLSLASRRHRPHELQLNFGEKPKLNFVRLIGSGGVFLCFVVVGVLFYHFYPGEDKTWLQAVYMSIITLSTVGFGALNATTEGGKVFGAFWMLLGVTSLVSFVAAFTEVMLKVKEIESWEGQHEEMMNNLAVLEQKEIEKGDQLDRYEFISFALVQGKLATQEQLATIEEEFRRLLPDSDGYISTAFLDAHLDSPSSES